MLINCVIIRWIGSTTADFLESIATPLPLYGLVLSISRSADPDPCRRHFARPVDFYYTITQNAIKTTGMQPGCYQLEDLVLLIYYGLFNRKVSSITRQLFTVCIIEQR